MKKVLAAVAVMALATALTGCAQEQPKADNPEPAKTEVSSNEKTNNVTIDPKIESGFSVDEMGFVNVGIVIENQNPELALSDTSLSITAKDADGKIIATDPEFKIGDMLPGEKFGFGITLYENNGVPATVDVVAKHGGVVKSSDIVPITVTQINASEFGYLGEFANSEARQIKDVMIGVIARDSSGAIVGGGCTDVNNVAASTTESFEINGYVIPNTTIEAYGHIYY